MTMNIWLSLLQWLGTLSVLSAALVWLAKTTAGHFLSRDLERFKADIRSANEAELERLRHDYQRVQYEHQVKYAWLHERSAKAIVRLYSLVVRVRRPLENVARAEIISDTLGTRVRSMIQSDLREVARSYGVLESFFLHNRLLFTPEICERMTRLLETIGYASMWLDLSQPESSVRGGAGEATVLQLRQDAIKAVNDIIPDLLARLEGAMRERLEPIGIPARAAR